MGQISEKKNTYTIHVYNISTYDFGDISYININLTSIFEHVNSCLAGFGANLQVQSSSGLEKVKEK